MRVGLVAGGVGALVLALAGGAVVAVHRNAQRAAETIASHERELRAAPATRVPMIPVQPGAFATCVSRPPGRERVTQDCAGAAGRESQGVPPPCRALMEDGNRWVEEWLRCAQRESIGVPRFEFRGTDAMTSSTAGFWLRLHLRVLPARQQLDECRLAVAQARDQLWAFGPSACLDGHALLDQIAGGCHLALAEATTDVRDAFAADLGKLAGQFPTNRWLATGLEVARLGDALQPHPTDRETFVDRFRAELALPGIVDDWDRLIARQPDAPVHFDNTGGPMAFDAMIECDQLRDLLKALATSPKPSAAP